MRTPGEIIGPIKLPLRINGATSLFQLYYYQFGDKRWLSALIDEQEDNDSMPLRIESSCVFGHILHSGKCDCGFQLDEALGRFAHNKKGCLIFGIDDDARGLGIEAHFRIYDMRQNENLDTEEVFKRLNTPSIDTRNYEAVHFILQHLGIQKISLLSNNEGRLTFLQSKGYDVKLESLEMKLNRFNMATLMLEKEDLQYRWSFKTHRDWLEPLQQKVVNDPDMQGGCMVWDNDKIVVEAFTHNWDLSVKLTDNLPAGFSGDERLIVYLTDLPRADEIEQYASLGIYFIVAPFPVIPPAYQQVARSKGVFIQDWGRSNRYTVERPQWELLYYTNDFSIYRKKNEIRYHLPGNMEAWKQLFQRVKDSSAVPGFTYSCFTGFISCTAMSSDEIDKLKKEKMISTVDAADGQKYLSINL